MDLDGRVTHPQLLDVGVDGDELDLGEPGVDHSIECVQAGASDADDLDHGKVGGGLPSRHAMEPRRLFRQRLQHRRRLGNWLQPNRLRLGLGLGLRLGNGGDRRLLGSLRKLGNVLDRLLLRLEGRGPDLRLGLSLLGLLLRGLGRAEELSERAFTHARAASRH